MPRTVVCFKWVPDEGELRVDRSTHEIDTSTARRLISAYDRNAIEAARRLAPEVGGDLVGLTVGGPGARAALKDALARGVDEAVHVVGPEQVDGHVTAHLLAAQVRSTPDVGLVVCGEGAADTYAHEVGPRLGEMLGWPVVTNARSVEVHGRTLVAQRVVGADVETVECDLPAVVTVLPEIGPAPIPGLKAVLAAARRPTAQVLAADLGFDEAGLARRTRVSRLVALATERSHTVISEGTAAEKADALIEALTQRGAL